MQLTGKQQAFGWIEHDRRQYRTGCGVLIALKAALALHRVIGRTADTQQGILGDHRQLALFVLFNRDQTDQALLQV
ncbi:hypothetical protein D3C86_2072350 [compost metagenome]